MTFDGCTLERDAAYMYALLMEAAEEDGVSLSYEDCYRSYGTSSLLVQFRCPVTETPTFGVDPLTGATVQTGVTVGPGVLGAADGPTRLFQPRLGPRHRLHRWERHPGAAPMRPSVGCREMPTASAGSIRTGRIAA